MKYPKILLTGGTGQLGHELLATLKLLGQVWAPNRQEFDLAHPESLQGKILAKEAHELSISLIHYSTEYVFNRTKIGSYMEEDVPSPLNIYGETKLEGERAIQDAHAQYLILWTSWLYSPMCGENFYRTMLNCSKRGKNPYGI